MTLLWQTFGAASTGESVPPSIPSFTCLAFNGGNLFIDLLGGYNPKIGDTFSVLLTGTGISGTDRVTASHGWSFFTDGNNGFVRFNGFSNVAAPEPGTLGLLVFAALPIISRRNDAFATKRRRNPIPKA